MSEPTEPSAGPVTTARAANGAAAPAENAAAPAENERPGRRKLKRTTRIGLLVILIVAVVPQKNTSKMAGLGTGLERKKKTPPPLLPV